MISAIVTVYNKAPFLERCLSSIANQTDKHAQIIIIDDGSSDGSGKICDRYGEKYGWSVWHTKNKGVSAARNLGLDNAEGDYVTFMDADDAYTPEAFDVMNRMARHQFNIVQFGQYRHHAVATHKDPIHKGRYRMDNLPRRWAMVWNKMYKQNFIEENKIRFIEGMQFGEDELFNVRAILANGGLYHAPQTLARHYFDDKKSLCRGELTLERLTKLVDKLLDMADKEPDQVKAQWLRHKARKHQNSALFRRFGYQRQPTGQYDVVYFLKDTQRNEELRYSLRTIEENWEYNRVWFYGGCPRGLRPDCHVPLKQTAPNKWRRVREMILGACQNDAITDDFWLFNDDFFVLKPISEDMPPQYNGTIEGQIKRVEARHGGMKTNYTRRLRHLLTTLQEAGLPTLNYSVHKPILVNRAKAVEVLEKFPNEPMFRALYANYWQIGGESKHDMKVMVPYFDLSKAGKWEFVSTNDQSFKSGNIGLYIREKFDGKSRFEV